MSAVGSSLSLTLLIINKVCGFPQRHNALHNVTEQSFDFLLLAVTPTQRVSTKGLAERMNIVNGYALLRTCRIRHQWRKSRVLCQR